MAPPYNGLSEREREIVLRRKAIAEEVERGYIEDGMKNQSESEARFLEDVARILLNLGLNPDEIEGEDNWATIYSAMHSTNDEEILYKLRKHFGLPNKYEEAMSTALQPIRVTNETRKFVKNNPHLHRGDGRFCTGMFYTDDEFEKQRVKSPKEKLP